MSSLLPRASKAGQQPIKMERLANVLADGVRANEKLDRAQNMIQFELVNDNTATVTPRASTPVRDWYLRQAYEQGARGCHESLRDMLQE